MFVLSLVLIDYCLKGFSIDRVSDDGRTVPQTFPTIIGWDQDHLRKCQLVEVGEGRFGSEDAAEISSC